MIQTEAAGVVCRLAAMPGSAVLTMAVSSEAMPTPIANAPMASARWAPCKPSRSASVFKTLGGKQFSVPEYNETAPVPLAAPANGARQYGRRPRSVLRRHKRTDDVSCHFIQYDVLINIGCFAPACALQTVIQHITSGPRCPSTTNPRSHHECTIER